MHSRGIAAASCQIASLCLLPLLVLLPPKLGLARDVAGIYKTVKDTTRGAPEKLDDPILDLFHVDPGYKEMIDDSVEYEFDKDMMGYLNSLPRDAPLPDMTQELEKWIQKKFDRKISGAEVTESFLRKIIREQILKDTRYD